MKVDVTVSCKWLTEAKKCTLKSWVKCKGNSDCEVVIYDSVCAYARYTPKPETIRPIKGK